MQNQIDNVPVWHRLLYAHSEYFNAYGRPSQYCACPQASIELLYNCCPLHRPNLSNQTYRTDACSALEDFAYPQFLAHGTSTVQLVKASISSKTTSSFSTCNASNFPVLSSWWILSRGEGHLKKIGSPIVTGKMALPSTTLGSMISIFRFFGSEPIHHACITFFKKNHPRIWMRTSGGNN